MRDFGNLILQDMPAYGKMWIEYGNWLENEASNAMVGPLPDESAVGDSFVSKLREAFKSGTGYPNLVTVEWLLKLGMEARQLAKTMLPLAEMYSEPEMVQLIQQFLKKTDKGPDED